MNSCLCGNPVEAGGTRCRRCAALLTLGLERDATEGAVKEAYRLLVKVWHPDRFHSDRKLREAADVKLKEINSAFKYLSSAAARKGYEKRAPEEPSYATYQTIPETEQSEPIFSATPIVNPGRVFLKRLRVAVGIFFKIAALAVFILLVRYTWIAFDVPDPTNGQVAEVYSVGKQSLLKELEAPKQRFNAAIVRDWRRLLGRSYGAAYGTQAAPSGNPYSAQQRAGSPRPAAPSPTPRVIRPYLTVGSTREEVLAMQGLPTASTENKLVYGNSELYLKDGSVTGWRIDSASPIRVKLWPSTPVDPAIASYTVGSSKDVVLVVQGTPTAFSDDKFEYGKSEVYFRNNRVVSWKEDPSVPLWAR
jgi:curved DNA-binding protein CbpA